MGVHQYIRLDQDDQQVFNEALADTHMYRKTLAVKANVDLETLDAWSRGKESLREDFVARVEEALGIPGAFLDRDEADVPSGGDELDEQLDAMTPQDAAAVIDYDAGRLVRPAEASGEGETANPRAVPSPEPDTKPEKWDIPEPEMDTSEPESDVAAVLVVTPEPVEEVAVDVAGESRAVIEDRSMQLFALSAVERFEYERVADRLAERESELVVAQGQVNKATEALETARADLESLRSSFEGVKRDYDTVCEALDEVRGQRDNATKLLEAYQRGEFAQSAPRPAPPQRLTASEWLDVRDEIADRVKNATAGVQFETKHFAAAEALLGLNLIDVTTVLNGLPKTDDVTWEQLQAAGS